MANLGVNVDHVATVRQARRTFEPDPVIAASLCQIAGAHGIVAHLREDRRHIQDRDIEMLREIVYVKFNLEMAATPQMVKKAVQIAPEQATLVPEKREEITTEGGLDVVKQKKHIRDVTKTLQEAGIIVSLFIDPEKDQLVASKETGADAIEIHTGQYALAKKEKEIDDEFEKIKDTAKLGRRLGLVVHAGHGLTYQNASRIAEIAEIEELNIGHSIISKAVLVGIERAVKEMLELIK